MTNKVDVAVLLELIDFYMDVDKQGLISNKAHALNVRARAIYAGFCHDKGATFKEIALSLGWAKAMPSRSCSKHEELLRDFDYRENYKIIVREYDKRRESEYPLRADV